MAKQPIREVDDDGATLEQIHAVAKELWAARRRCELLNEELKDAKKKRDSLQAEHDGLTGAAPREPTLLDGLEGDSE